MRVKSHTDSRAFSLMELMLVLTIMTIVITFSIGSYFQLNVNMAMSETGGKIENALHGARQLAVTTGDAVEVRFYHSAEPDPEVEADEESVPSIDAIQLARQHDDGSYSAEIPIDLSENLRISKSPGYSSFFIEDPSTEMLIRGKAGSLLPDYPEKEFTAFRYHPDGSTSLPVGKWFFTLLFEADLAKPDEAGNFYTIQIDPVLGRVETFRP